MSGFRLCHQGHSNPLNSRYCHQCGASLIDGTDVVGRIVGDRYRILRDIGHGGFGRTYLAEDSNRFNERCILKELAPSVENQETLDKAKELFGREAEVLYQLQHPQIPRFREWFVDPAQQSMFLVQDYVEGPTYQEILRDRAPQTFSESEVVTLLTQLLPVLSYIHGRGVVHRDLSPDNLICRNSDRLPVLIDFGGVKAGTASVSQAAKTAEAESSRQNVTLIGKPGYSPEEQMRRGQVSAASDLYALGVTALVLLIGQEPADLYDSFNLKFDWHDKAVVSSGVTAILDKMVSSQMNDRYTASVLVLQDLQRLSHPTAAVGQSSRAATASSSLPAAGTEVFGKTIVVAPKGTAIASEAVPAQPSKSPFTPLLKVPGLILQGVWGLIRGLLIVMLLVGAGALGWVVVRGWLQQQNFSPPKPVSTQSYSTDEQSRKAQLLTQLEQSQIPSGFFYRLVNEAYYLQYPDQQGKLLGNGSEDIARRSNWDRVALQTLAFVGQLSPSVRTRLGRYTGQDYRLRGQRLQSGSDRPVNEAAEAMLVDALPMYRQADIHDPATSIFQVLNGLVEDWLQTTAI